MALKSKITDKAEFDKLSDDLKKEYTEKDGAWFLQADDLSELRTLLETERNDRKKLEDELKVIRDAAKKADDEKREAEELAARERAKKEQDWDALENSYKAKVTEAENKGKEKIANLEKIIENLTVESGAKVMAAEISTVPELMEPIILRRLRPEIHGDKVITRVLNPDGTPSALSLDDLKKEIVANKSYATIIKAGNGSGGGAGGNNSGGGATKKISEMTEKERVAYHNEVGGDAYRAQARSEGLPV